MLVRTMRDFVREPVSRCRLAEAFERACPKFAAWCDDPTNGLNRTEFFEQLEAMWRSQLDRSLPLVGATDEGEAVSSVVKSAATI